MIIKCYKDNVFIPKWNGNKKEADPIKIKHRYLTPEERDKYFYYQPLKVTPKTDGYEVVLVEDKKGCCKAIVIGIENFALEVNGEKIVIDTVKKLYETEGVPNALIKEIEEYMSNASPVIDEKSLK